MNMRSAQASRQKGAIDLVTIFAILFLGVAILCGIKLGPIYIDHWTVKEALTTVIEEAARERVTSKKKILGKLQSRLMVNRIEFLEDENIKIERSTSQLQAQLNYERRVPLIFNLDVVVKFPESLAEATLAAKAR